MSDYPIKRGHPVLAIVLGILGILIAFFLTLIGGVIAGAVALILGVVALLLGISGRKAGGSGLGGIIIGALAIILAVAMTFGTISTFTEIQKQAEKYADEAPLVVKSLKSPYLGMVGMMVNVPKDEGSLDELTKQFNLVSEKIKEANAAK